MQIYAFEMTDGMAEIMSIYGDTDVQREIEQWTPENQARVIRYHLITEAQLPSDKFFRNAWEFSGGLVVENLDKAKALRLDQFRQMRAPLLAALDIEFDKALEKSDTAKQKAIADKKQALRDVTLVDLSAITTTDELRAFVPDVLK